MMRIWVMIVSWALVTSMGAAAQGADDLALPELLRTSSGDLVTTPEAWRDQRRPELLELFRTHIYGRAPVTRPGDLAFEVTETDAQALDGQATRKNVALTFSGPAGKGKIRLHLFVPNSATKPVSCFLLICHRDLRSMDHTREQRVPFWPVEEIIARGHASAVFNVANVDPDRHDDFQNGVHGIFQQPGAQRKPDDWAGIAAWAWGASRCMDYFETDADIDTAHCAVIGHSRGGKTALWCGAEDERFALVISNNSGCTGAALARRKRGETIQAINRGFPHWFCDNYDQYNESEDALPVDQHMLIALQAPRLVYVASASKDGWADPLGEFLACVYAEPAFGLFGLGGVGAAQQPPVNTPLQTGHIAYHLRDGKHDLSLYDWQQYMNFAELHWR